MNQVNCVPTSGGLSAISKKYFCKYCTKRWEKGNPLPICNQPQK